MAETFRYFDLVSITSRVPAGSVFSGRTAAWVHGIDRVPPEVFEVTLPRLTRTSRLRRAMLVRSDLEPDEIVTVDDITVTSPTRTVADLGRRASLIEAVAIIEHALHRRLITRGHLARWISTHRGFKGVRQLQKALELSNSAAESPMETRLRLLLTSHGLPCPDVQANLFDATSVFLGRADLYYPSARLVIEYDGVTHRTRMAADNRRQNRLLEAGYRLLRFTAFDVIRTPAAVVGQVERALTRPRDS